MLLKLKQKTAKRSTSDSLTARRNVNVLAPGKSLAIAVGVSLCFAAAVQAQDEGTSSDADLRDAHPDWVQTPGLLIRPDCVHKVPNGAELETEDDGVTVDVAMDGIPVQQYGPCPEPGIRTGSTINSEPDLSDAASNANNWLEDFHYFGRDQVVSLTATWTVPTKPAVNGGLIYIHDSLESADGDWIFAPVLQYGYNGLFGGNHWIIASYFTHGNTSVYYSGPELVFVGNKLRGYVSIVSIRSSGTRRNVTVVDETNHAFTGFEYTTKGLNWTRSIAATIEAHDISRCDQLPAVSSVRFANVTVRPNHGWDRGVNPSWSGPDCHPNPSSTVTDLILSWRP